ncbi:hypothetical protein K438DRAFT_1981630 [Mycena galopus ATCC 62051]|nr:hypothetical protein K438DRAFT_1981630 [Mycena galopus ATCC 62051]
MVARPRQATPPLLRRLGDELGPPHVGPSPTDPGRRSLVDRFSSPPKEDVEMPDISVFRRYQVPLWERVGEIKRHRLQRHDRPGKRLRKEAKEADELRYEEERLLQVTLTMDAQAQPTNMEEGGYDPDNHTVLLQPKFHGVSPVTSSVHWERCSLIGNHIKFPYMGSV